MKKNSQILATAIIGNIVGVKYAMRSNARPASLAFTAKAISKASATETGMVTAAYQALLASAFQNTGSSTRSA